MLRIPHLRGSHFACDVEILERAASKHDGSVSLFIEFHCGHSLARRRRVFQRAGDPGGKDTTHRPRAEAEPVVGSNECGHEPEPDAHAVVLSAAGRVDGIGDGADGSSSMSMNMDADFSGSMLKRIGDEIMKDPSKMLWIGLDLAIGVATHLDETLLFGGEETVHVEHFFKQITEVHALEVKRQPVLFGARHEEGLVDIAREPSEFVLK